MSIRIFTWQSRANASLFHSIHATTFTPFLEAQQRYFSYRAMLVAIVSQNSLVLVLMGYRTIIARYVAKWGIAQVCLCETKCQGGGGSQHFGGAANLP